MATNRVIKTSVQEFDTKAEADAFILGVNYVNDSSLEQCPNTPICLTTGRWLVCIHDAGFDDPDIAETCVYCGAPNPPSPPPAGWDKV